MPLRLSFCLLQLRLLQVRMLRPLRLLTRSLLNSCALLAMLFILGGCASTEAEKEEAKQNAQREAQLPLNSVANTCQDPRPEMCTFIYAPVCALRDSAVRCVTTPCESTEWQTYSNGCSACTDSKVLGYNDGACNE